MEGGLSVCQWARQTPNGGQLVSPPAEERLRLHPVPEQPFTAAFGESRRAGKDSTISVNSVRYSVPHELVEESVRVRFHGDDLIVTAMVAGGAAEVARHARSTPGNLPDAQGSKDNTRSTAPSRRRPHSERVEAGNGFEHLPHAGPFGAVLEEDDGVRTVHRIEGDDAQLARTARGCPLAAGGGVA